MRNIQQEGFSLDKNGIWIKNGSREQTFFYPKDGNNVSFVLMQNSFWFKHRNNVILKIINRFPFQSNFADIGGGNGNQVMFLSEKINENKFFLIEPDYFGCVNAKKLGVEKVFNMGFEEFPFEKYVVNGIGLFDVIEHIENPVSFLKSLKSKLQKNSMIYFTVPAYSWLWSDVDDLALHFTRYNQNSMMTLASKSDLKLEYCSYFFSYLVVPSFLLRALPYKIRGKRNYATILEKEIEQHKAEGNLSGSIIGKLNTFELRRLTSGRLPFGASLIGVLST